MPLFGAEFAAPNKGTTIYKIAVPLFGAAFAAPNKGTTILY